MKVYVFTYHHAVDCEFLGVTNQVFASKDDAFRAFDKWRKDEMKYVVDDGWTIGTNTPEHFEAYEDGYYNHNHTEGFINEYEVQEATNIPVEKPKSDKPTLDDIVTITCYNKTEQRVRRKAITFYADCMVNSEGAECERYMKIYMQLMNGEMECHD